MSFEAIFLFPPPLPEDPLTCCFIHRKLIRQDAADLAEGGHLDAILLQLALHVVDLLLCRRRQNRRKG